MERKRNEISDPKDSAKLTENDDHDYSQPDRRMII